MQEFKACSGVAKNITNAAKGFIKFCITDLNFMSMDVTIDVNDFY